MSEEVRLDGIEPLLVCAIRASGTEMFQYLVLGLLRDGKPRHGYALMKDYRDRSGVQLSTGSFYRELQKLAAKGLVRTSANPEGADPRRAPYEITPEGTAAFDGWLVAPARPNPDDYEDELSCRALFVWQAGQAVVRAVLDRWQEALWISGKMLERAREGAAPPLGDPNTPFGALALLLGRRLKHVAADLEFLQELRATYEQWAARSEEPDVSKAQGAGSRGRRGR